MAEWPWDEIKALILSPGVPLTHPKPHRRWRNCAKTWVPGHRRYRIAVFRAQPKALYVGITGTNGKSTTTTLIGHILKSRRGDRKPEVGGNLGTSGAGF